MSNSNLCYLLLNSSLNGFKALDTIINYVDEDGIHGLMFYYDGISSYILALLNLHETEKPKKTKK